jgi:hypothetical protein
MTKPTDSITITLTHEEAQRLEIATAEVPYLLANAEGAFAVLHSGYAGGFLDGHHGAVCIMELCARAFKSAAESEGEAIAMLDGKLRTALSVRAEQIRQIDIAAQEERAQHLAGAQAFVDQWAAQGYRNADELPGHKRKPKTTEPEGSAEP